MNKAGRLHFRTWESCNQSLIARGFSEDEIRALKVLAMGYHGVFLPAWKEDDDDWMGYYSLTLTKTVHDEWIINTEHKRDW